MGSLARATAAVIVIAASARSETIIVRSGPCASPHGSYLLAANAGALIRVEDPVMAEEGSGVIVYRIRPNRGWASRRLLSRFDLDLGAAQPGIVNTGEFCSD